MGMALCADALVTMGDVGQTVVCEQVQACAEMCHRSHGQGCYSSSAPALIGVGVVLAVGVQRVVVALLHGTPGLI